MAETWRKFDQDFRDGAVRLVRETGKPIARVARDLGIHDGALGNWVNAERCRRQAGGDVLGESERAELVRLRREVAELRMQCDSPQALACPLGQRHDGPVAVAGFIAIQRARYGIPYATSRRGLGISQSWPYKWRHGDVSLRRSRR